MKDQFSQTNFPLLLSSTSHRGQPTLNHSHIVTHGDTKPNREHNIICHFSHHITQISHQSSRQSHENPKPKPTSYTETRSSTKTITRKPRAKNHQVKHKVKTIIEVSQNRNRSFVKKPKPNRDEQLHRRAKATTDATKGNHKTKAIAKSTTKKHSQIKSHSQKPKPIRNPQTKLPSQNHMNNHKQQPKRNSQLKVIDTQIKIKVILKKYYSNLRSAMTQGIEEEEAQKD